MRSDIIANQGLSYSGPSDTGDRRRICGVTAFGRKARDSKNGSETAACQIDVRCFVASL